MKKSISILWLLAVIFALGTETRAQSPTLANQATSQLQKSGYELSDKFTAQRRPRVTVLSFENTNHSAVSAGYGASVEAMLVTFLKRKSQFVVIERSEIRKLLEERQRLRTGMVEVDPGDAAGRELLERVDVYILGKVTLLDEVQAGAKTASATSEPKPAPEPDPYDAEPASRQSEVRGPRIEVDAKLISRFDGRIIAAAQRSGPVACLRSIVERLGIAMEQDFLRPYYGQLRFVLKDPEYVRVYLTPILLDTALDEEKPPVELGTTVEIGADQDVVWPWTTDPTTYTIGNLLSGWYSMRLERPGYQGLGTSNDRWLARDLFGEVKIFEVKSPKRIEPTKAEAQPFLVKVEPLGIATINGADRGFVFQKQGGSFSARVKRQYLDTDFSGTPRRVVLLGGEKVDINKIDRPKEFADDETCDLFDERKPGPPEYGRTYVAAGETFDFENFNGGELIIEDYHGEKIPVGDYQMMLWEPSYIRQVAHVRVHDGDDQKVTRTALVRQTMPLALDAISPRPKNHGILEGRDTHYRIGVPLDFSQPKEQAGVPVDVYAASTDVPGLEGWSQSVELSAGPTAVPAYQTASKPFEPVVIGGMPEKLAGNPPLINFKTRFGLGGRLDVFSRRPDPVAADLFVVDDIPEILDLLLANRDERIHEARGGFWKRMFSGGRAALPVVASQNASLQIANASIGISAAVEAGLQARSVLTSQATAEPPSLPCSGTAGLARSRRQSLLPCDPEALRALLADRLASVDLLVLDARDMDGLERSPETALIVSRWVHAGGALFAFVAGEGDYGEVVGSPINVESLSRRTRRFKLAPGEVGAVVPVLQKKVKVKKRALPELPDLPADGSWRVLAFTEGEDDPRILEHTSREQGGYVLLWLDDPHTFVGRLGGKVAKVEETRRRVEEHLFKWARYVMYRRYDKSGELRTRAEDALLH